MKEVNVRLYEITPEEIALLPNGTQMIEYHTGTGKMKIRRKDSKAFDFGCCVYLLSVKPK